MKITVPLTDGFLPARFTKHADATDFLAGVPVRSFPITITEAPTATQAFALSLIDFDATPVCGFPWVHWLAANLPATWLTIPETASREPKLAAQFIQGKNSNANALAPRPTSVTTGYTGPQPPDKAHAYTLTVYALDEQLQLAPGFWLNDLRRALRGHVLAKAQLELPCQV